MADSEPKHKLICPHGSCQKSFSKESRFKAHLNVHTGVRPYKCQEEGCVKAFTRAQHLKRHVDVTHRCITPEPVKCEYENCEKMFPTQANLDRHIRTVHKEASYACTEEGCKEKFKKHHQLKAHLFSHKGLLPFQCSFEDCLKKFSQKSHLVRHLKVHQGYKCTNENCEEVFQKWSLVRKHIMIAHPKVYSCPDCKAQFPKPSLLKKHMTRHTGSVELFKCTYEECPRSYVEMRNLTAHIKSYHEGKLFKCETSGCDRKFSTKQKLLQHEKVHDPNVPPPKKKPRLNQHRKKSLAAKLTGVDEYKLKKEAAKKTKELTCTVTSSNEEPTRVTEKDIQSNLDLNRDDTEKEDQNSIKNPQVMNDKVIKLEKDCICDVKRELESEVYNERINKICNSHVKRTYGEGDREHHLTKKLRVTE